MNFIHQETGLLTRFYKKLAKQIALMPLLLIVSLAGFGQLATIFVNPSVSNVQVGQSFTVRVSVDVGAQSINAIEVGLNFNRAFLQVTNITRPSSSIFTSEVIQIPTDYSTMNGTGTGAGQITYVAGIPGNFISVDFDLLEITFTATQSGSTGLIFNTVAPRNTRAVLGGTIVTGPPTNGSVNITANCTPPTATIGNSSTCNGQNFNLLLNAASGTAPFDLVINGVTYNDINVGQVIANVAPPILGLYENVSLAGRVDEVDAPVTLGMRFQSSVPGLVRGLRFFSHGGAVGSFSGQLWSGTGTLLASGNFVSINQGDWTELQFSTPVSIAANTNYIISYHTSIGFYTARTGDFNSNLTAGPLTGFQGIYTYGSTPAFPTSSFQASGYFVDVLFAPSVFSYELTQVTGADGCTSSGALQTLNVSSPDCSTLPVEFLSISASAEGSNRIVVNWSTGSEQNNKGFEVFRSLDGRGNWQSVGFVNGAGDSEVRRDYSFTDENLSARRYFYQLKQIDYDGRFKLSAVVSADLSGKTGFSLEQNYPNPFKSQETTIRFSLPRKAQVQLVVYDMNGRVIKTLVNGTRDAGTHAIPFQDPSLPTGIYFYKIMADGFSEVKKMTIR